VTFELHHQGIAAANLMTKDEARRIAVGIAKLPDLLGAAQPDGPNPSKSASA
jgi:hypothetical protein